MGDVVVIKVTVVWVENCLLLCSLDCDIHVNIVFLLYIKDEELWSVQVLWFIFNTKRKNHDFIHEMEIIFRVVISW